MYKDGLIIIRGKLEYYNGTNTVVTIPDNVHSIGDRAFSNRSLLTSITIPEGVQSIGDSAFSSCESLTSITIPEGVQSIGDSAFFSCESLTSVTIPDSVQSIGHDAFYGCNSLKSITIPDSVQSIGDKAFYDCKSLSVTIPDNVASLGVAVFSGCKEIIVPEHSPVLNQLHDLIGSGSYKLTIKMNDGTYRKTAMTARLSPFEISRLDDFDTLLKFGRFGDETIKEENRIIAMIDRLKDNENIVSTETKTAFVDYLQERIRKVIKITVSTEDDLKFLLKTGIINEFNLSDVQKIFKKNPAFLELCVLEKQEDENIDPMQKECEQRLIKEKWNAKLQKYRLVSFVGVKLKDGSPAPDSYSRALTAVLMFSWFVNDIKYADQIADLLDTQSYLEVMQKYYDEAYFKEKVTLAKPICRFADGNTIRKINSEFEKSKFKEDILNAIILSNTRDAQLILDKKHMLDEYAELHGLNKDLLEAEMLDTGLDKERKKYYDLGNQTVAVQMNSDFTFVVINPTTGKVTKTLPKKGADPTKYKEAEKDFKELKQNVRKVAKNRSTTLLSDFLRGKSTEAEMWKKMYFDNPVLHDIGKLVVWKQGKDTFIVGDDRLENCSGNSYEITDEPVYVAHPMDMEDHEILYWQQYFAKNQLKQPFIQVWEPVLDSSKVNLFIDVPLPLYRFVNRDIHGIRVLNQNSFYDPVFRFEDCSVIIEKENRHDVVKIDTNFVIYSFEFKEYTKMVNHIVAYLLRCVAEKIVLENDDSIIPILPTLTYELTNKLLKVALENNCSNVSATLLDYIEKNYSNYDPMDEFTLEL